MPKVSAASPFPAQGMHAGLGGGYGEERFRKSKKFIYVNI